MDYSCSIITRTISVKLTKCFLVVVENDGTANGCVHKFELPGYLCHRVEASGKYICFVGWSRYDQEEGKRNNMRDMHILNFKDGSIHYMYCLPLDLNDHFMISKKLLGFCFRGNIACYCNYKNAVRFFEIEEGRELDPLLVSEECDIISISFAYASSERRCICAYIMEQRQPNTWTLNIVDVMDRNYAWSIPFDNAWSVKDRRRLSHSLIYDHPTCLELSHDGMRVALAYNDHVHILKIDFRTLVSGAVYDLFSK